LGIIFYPYLYRHARRMNPYLIYLLVFFRTYYAFLLCDLPSQYGMVLDRPHLQMPLVEIGLRII